MNDPVLYEVDGHVVIITLNEPTRRNAMRAELLEAFGACVTRAKEEPDVRVLVVRGSGKHFCSGADFSALGAMAGEASAQVGGMRSVIRRIYGYFLCLLELEIPTIAHINGSAFGGGLGLALACDLRVADKRAKLAANFVKLGLGPGMAISYFLPRLIGVPRAAELMFTGRVIRGEEAERIGLVHYACDRGADLDARVRELADEVASGAPLALRLTKRALYSGLEFSPERALDFEAFAQLACIQTEDFQEGISALMERRAPRFGTDRT